MKPSSSHALALTEGEGPYTTVQSLDETSEVRTQKPRSHRSEMRAKRLSALPFSVLRDTTLRALEDVIIDYNLLPHGVMTKPVWRRLKAQYEHGNSVEFLRRILVMIQATVGSYVRSKPESPQNRLHIQEKMRNAHRALQRIIDQLKN